MTYLSTPTPIIFVVVLLFVLLEVLSTYYVRYIAFFPWLSRTLWIGIFLHEFAHYLACKLTFAKVKQFRVHMLQGHVIHQRSKIPLLGDFFITLAPFLLGCVILLVLFLWITHLSFFEFWNIVSPAWTLQFPVWKQVFWTTLKNIDVISWEFPLFLFGLLNILATFVPSHRDYKNVLIAIVFYIVASYFLPFINPVNQVLAALLLFSNFLLIVAVFVLFFTSRLKLFLARK